MYQGALAHVQDHYAWKKTGAAAPHKNHHNAGEAPAPAAPGEPGKTMPEQLAQNLKTQGDAMIQYGARLLVMRELLCSLTTGLPPAARASAEQRFRQRINQLMSATDDHVLPRNSTAHCWPRSITIWAS